MAGLKLTVIKELPTLSPQTRIYYRGSKDYVRYAYQYATTSHQDDTMSPAAIVFPKTLKDITLAINYARENGMGIAVRTGGHQYSGASSTSGNNIQLDLSDTFQSVVRDFRYNHTTKLLRVGVSFSLLQFHSLLRSMKMFLPHGTCSNVHLGGHVQSGGYGMLRRSFGLLCDYIEGFEIILANGKHEKIWRPNGPLAPKDLELDSNKSKENDDLFWAVLGGSPGNFGILTHVQIRPLHDDDYPDSRIMKVFTLYTKEKLEKCLQLSAEIVADQDLPRNFDFAVSVGTSTAMSFYSNHAVGRPNKENKELHLDEQMILHYPEQYADGVPWAEEGKLALSRRPFHSIGITAHWINVNGKDTKFGEKETEWFERIREAMGPPLIDAVELHASEESPEEVQGNFIKFLLGDPNATYPKVLYTTPTPISEIMRYYVWDDVREYPQPFCKATYMTDKTDLHTNGWVQWLSERVDIITKLEESDGVNALLYVTPAGGQSSMYRRLAEDNPGDDSISWRNETTCYVTIDGYYDPTNQNALQTVSEWQTKNHECAKEGGVFCDKDRRFLWGSYARVDDKDGGAILDSVWEKYYDTKEKYDRLVKIKRRVDPDYIFTANAFGVDATNAPKEKQSIIAAHDFDLRENGSQSKEFTE